MIKKRLLLAVMATALTACGNLKIADNAGFDTTISLAGAKPGMSGEFERVDLVGLLDPSDRLKLREHRDSAVPELPLGEQYDKALSGFARRGESAQSLQLRRNLVQNRLIAASDLRCGRFIRHLRTQGSEANFGLGVATTLFSAAAAVVPGVSDAKTLAALGALASGTRAEFNTEYFSNLSIHLIVRSIQDLRTTLRDQMTTGQNQVAYANYDVAAAVAEAIRYDASCNIIYGLEHANEAVQRLQEPGREAVSRALIKDKLNAAIATGNDAEVNKYQAIAAGVRQANAAMGNGALQTAAGGVGTRSGLSEAENPLYHLLDVQDQTLKTLAKTKDFMTGVVARVGDATVTKAERDELASLTSASLAGTPWSTRFQQCRATAEKLQIDRMAAAYALEKAQAQAPADEAISLDQQQALQRAELAAAQFNAFVDVFPQQLQFRQRQWTVDLADPVVGKLTPAAFKSLWATKSKELTDSLPSVDARCLVAK